MLTIALLIVFTLLCILLSGDRAWDNVTKPERNDLVFQGRHRAYGAYVLRRDYERRSVLAFVGALAVMGGAIVVPHALSLLGAGTNAMVPVVPRIMVDVELKDLPFEPPAPDPEPVQPAPKPAAAAPVAPAPEPGYVEATDSLLVVDTVSASAPAPGPVAPVGGGTPAPGGGGAPSGGGPSPFTPDAPADLGVVEVVPEFIGGHAAMTRFIQDNLRIHNDDITQAKEWVAFVVDADGSVVRVHAKGRAEKAFSDAAERVVKAMPKWKPAKYKGKDVPCVLVLPIELTTR
ncbi:MAG: energy transducer TonB [Flavobacteriales bacterium]|nr:energy transducer TonB [Flavobacteriales bacterium]